MFVNELAHFLVKFLVSFKVIDLQRLIIEPRDSAEFVGKLAADGPRWSPFEKHMDAHSFLSLAS